LTFVSVQSTDLDLVTQNGIPVFCPALTDGSFTDMLWGHSCKTEVPLVIDIVANIRRLNYLSMRARKAGMVIPGGGVCKHQIANSMLLVSPLSPTVSLEAGADWLSS
jgi:deoxyhypusine synthase